ncbi:unnamed protein product [Larinioides sclopetarius]|uniref:Uncharacterized protein n=1 Tax=Larinioides sclopetarius TaxID=280406 RepID=A0AAV2A1B2_9ARAC
MDYLNDAILSYTAKYFSTEDANAIFKKLQTEIRYLPEGTTQIHLTDTIVHMPRQLAVYGTELLKYKFNNHTLVVQNWTPILNYLRRVADNIIQDTDKRHNFATVERYNNGLDMENGNITIEPTIDNTCPMITFVFGARHPTIFKRPHQRKRFLSLTHGSMFKMKPTENTHRAIEIPKRSRTIQQTITVTFKRCNMPISNNNL